jgi:capsular polysaccharide export protein
VRAARPDAWIVYKPHPDTEAGTRAGAVEEAQALRHADQVVRGVSAAALFPQVDEVHTMTSLLGFEALLRGLPVTTWGQPFYAGWGLTRDRLPPPRRGRAASLDELVAAALIVYPLYVDPASGRPCEAEDVAHGLAGRQAAAAGQRGGAQRIARLCRGLVRSWVSAHVRR